MSAPVLASSSAMPHLAVFPSSTQSFVNGSRTLVWTNTRWGATQVCPAQRIVQVDGADITLTNKEFELLCLLLENQGIVLARATLMDRVWGMELERENRTLDVHVRTLRAKLGPAGGLIETVRGVGYKMGGTRA